MSFIDQSLDNTDPELAAIIKQAQQTQQISICLLPEESFITPKVQNISRTSFKEGSYEKIAKQISSLVDFDFVDLRLDAKHEAVFCVAAAATDGNNETGILYLDLMGFQRGKDNPSIASFVQTQFVNTEEVVGENTDLGNIFTKERSLSVKLVIVDASMYPKKVDFQRFRYLADSIEAYLAIDIGYFTGLAVAKVYDSTLQVADFVIGDSGGTLGGPSGAMLFAKDRFEPALMVMIDQYTGEDYDIGSSMAKAVAIEQAYLEDGRSVQSQSVNNARELFSNLRNEGINVLFERTDTHLVLADLSGQIDARDAARRLYEIGILASAGTVGTHSSKESDVLCFGTSVVTHQGMGSSEMRLLAEIIGKALSQSKSDNTTDLRSTIARLGMKFQ